MNCLPDCFRDRDNTLEKLLFLLTAAVLHELGHVLCAAILHIPFAGLTIRPCGAVMTFDFSGTTYGRELCVHLAGAGTGVISAALALWIFGDAAVYFAGVSVTLAVLNLLPVGGFDGGGALFCLLALCLPADRAERVCGAVSRGMLLLLWAAVLWLELRLGTGTVLLLYLLYVMIFYTGIVNFQ